MINKVATKLAASAFVLALVAGPVTAADYSTWNTDGTDGVTKEEFRAGFSQNQAFDRWDADNDGNLSQAEFQQGLGDNQEAFNTRYGDGWFEKWDANSDSAIGETEYYDGLYAGYDANSNNVIEEPEFGDLGDDMGDGGWFDV